MYTGIGLLLLIRPFISSFFFLSIFRHLFSGTVRLRRLKLGTHIDSGQMYRVYWNQATATYSSLYFSFSRFSFRLDMTLAVDWAVKPQRKQN